MAFELKENSGIIFKNEKKEKDTHADYNGEINVNGSLFYINLWVKSGKESGKKFFSASIKAKQQGYNNQSKPSVTNDGENNLPF